MANDRHDWTKPAAVAVASVALIVSVVSSASSWRSAAAAERSAANSGKSADVASLALQFQREQAQWSCAIYADLQKNVSKPKLIVTITNTGAANTIRSCGFELPATTKSDLRFVPIATDVPRRLDRNDAMAYVVGYDDIAKWPEGRREEVLGICVQLATGEVLRCAHRSVFDFMRSRDSTPIDLPLPPIPPSTTEGGQQ